MISRVQAIKESRKSTSAAEADIWWYTYVDVIIKPRAGLSDGQRSAIEADFGMTGGLLKVSCRKAFTFYLLRQMQLDRPPDRQAATQPLELMNREELADVIAAALKTPEPISKLKIA